MRWFKHISTSYQDEKLANVLSVLGIEGYGFWWRMLEVVAERMTLDETEVTYPIKYFANIFGFSEKKFEKFVKVFENLKIFRANFEKKQENFSGKSQTYVTISIPNLLKYRDEYTEKKSQKSGVCRDSVGTNSAPETEIELNNTISGGNNINNNILNNISSPDPLLTPPSLDEKNLPQDISNSTQNKNKPCIEPNGYFNQLRTVYNRFKNEGSIAGWHEFQAYCKDKSNPDVLTLICDLETRSETDQWKKGYVPSMARYLREKLWEQPTEELQDCKKNQPEDLVAYYERIKNKQNSEDKSV